MSGLPKSSRTRILAVLSIVFLMSVIALAQK
jgi:hypothetical protein